MSHQEFDLIIGQSIQIGSQRLTVLEVDVETGEVLFQLDELAADGAFSLPSLPR